MKIVEIIPHLTSGGAERFTVDLCNELAERHEVWLLLFFPLENIKLHFLLPEVSEKVHVLSLNKHKGFDLGVVWTIRTTIKNISPDIVHCHINSLEYVALARLLGKNNCRWYYTVHSDARYDAGQGFVNRIRRYAIRHRLFTPVTISDESLRSFRDFYGYDTPMITNGRKTPTIPLKGGRKSPFKGDLEGLVLVSLARFSQVKRQDMLARIAKRLESEGYNFKLQFVGQHQDKKMYDAVMKAINKAPSTLGEGRGGASIEIVGEVNNPLDYLAEADAFCLCSSNEGMPISLIEAMAMGAVPVCTPVGGIVNVVNDGINGFLSDNITEEAYYRALKRFLDSPKDKIKEMSVQAVEAVKPYSMDECARKYEQMFLMHNS
ncbi:MAG: glycosyltransferase family 4 protein [Prevotella sp.]|nr:glycosyltransferase family 4 protein [Candidatus Prevotella equi]